MRRDVIAFLLAALLVVLLALPFLPTGKVEEPVAEPAELADPLEGCTATASFETPNGKVLVMLLCPDSTGPRPKEEK